MTDTPRITIAIDGFSSSGKSTMARELARRLGYTYIDSGAMYRAVTLYGLRAGTVGGGSVDADALTRSLPDICIAFAPAGADGVAHTLLNGEDVEALIRSLEVAENVSPVAAIGSVRRRLTDLQQSLGRGKGIVMDGRDIGTTVFPDAEMKVFVNASPETRARRRLLEMRRKGMDADYGEVLANIRERDDIDRSRAVSPLRRADDAIDLDNDSLTPEEQMEFLMLTYGEIIKRLSGRARD